MKKFLVLALVLSIASMASAVTVTLTTTDASALGGTVSLNITGGSDTEMAIVITNDGGTSTLTNFVCNTANAGTMSLRDYYASELPDPLLSGSGIGGGEVWILATNVLPEVHHDGTWLTADWTRTTNVWAYAYYVDTSTGYTTGKAAEVYIPEPATIALLGLGGLALLRRRK